MPTFGVHAFTWKGTWTNENAPDTIRLTAEAGFDLLEIPLLHPKEFDAAMVKRELTKHKIRGVGSLALPKDTHLPFYPDRALSFLKLAVDKTAEMGGDALSGCLYCNLGTLTGKPPTKEERDTVCNVLGEVDRYSQQRGVRLGIEPVNRYETYLYNIGTDVADLLKAINTNNMFIHFDTYHMNIEEHTFSAPIKQAGALCGYIHLSESDRGIPGQGNVNWDDTFAGLKAINYKGPLVLEGFADINPDLIGATCLWRPGTFSSNTLATEGLAFIRQKAEKFGLQ